MNDYISWRLCHYSYYPEVILNLDSNNFKPNGLYLAPELDWSTKNLGLTYTANENDPNFIETFYRYYHQIKIHDYSTIYNIYDYATMMNFYYDYGIKSKDKIQYNYQKLINDGYTGLSINYVELKKLNNSFFSWQFKQDNHKLFASIISIYGLYECNTVIMFDLSNIEIMSSVLIEE